MKPTPDQSDRLFRDRPLSEAASDTRPGRALRPSQLEHTDPVDVLLRAFLVLCLLGSLAVSIRQWSAPATAIAVQPVAASPAMVQAAIPARPSVL